MNSIADMREVQLRDVEGTIKMATDGEMLDIRYQYNEGTSAKITARTVTSCNQLPRFYEKSDAIWERLRIISFPVKFRGMPNQNKNLRYEIVADELPGIFVWALKGLADLQEMNVFPEHSLGEEIKAKHKSACDPIGTFLVQSFERSDECKLESAYIFDKYKAWANAGGYRIANRGIVNREVERVFSVEKKVIKRSDGKTCQGFKGISVIPGAFPRQESPI
jgi:putative DNA primase/helicase